MTWESLQSPVGDTQGTLGDGPELRGRGEVSEDCTGMSGVRVPTAELEAGLWYERNVEKRRQRRSFREARCSFTVQLDAPTAQ